MTNHLNVHALPLNRVNADRKPSPIQDIDSPKKRQKLDLLGNEKFI